MRLPIVAGIGGQSVRDGDPGPRITFSGKVLYVNIMSTEHDEGHPKLTPVFLLDGTYRILPDASLFGALALPETCAKNKSGEVVCVTHQKLFPGQQNQAAALELAHCPCCGNRLIFFEDAPVPTM